MVNKSYQKRCKKCGSIAIKKDGFKRGKQRWKCKECGHVFQNKTRTVKKKIKHIWNEYCFGKQTYSELSEKYGKSLKQIQQLLDSYEFISPQITPTEVIVLMDTTYFGEFGVMAFKSYETGKVIHYRIVSNENNTDYKEGVRKLQEEGWKIKAIVCDGRKGLLSGFPDIPTQMCQFHQVAIIRRYITKNPILKANKDLKWIANLLKQTDKETFTYYLEQYGKKYESFLKEKTLGKDGKMRYVHNRTRSAYFSLKNNLKYLFTWYDYHNTIDIPNTTNALEGAFGHLKTKVALHRGLKKERKIKLILSLLNGKN